MHCFCIYLNFIHHGNQSRFARSEKTIDAMNRELGHVLHISTRHSGSTHYWNAATLGEYLEFLGSELRAKRMKHGLDASSKALILMDKATVHQSSTFEKLRDRFQRAHNCILLHGASYQYVAILQPQEANTSLKAIFVCCRSLCIQTHIHISKDSGVYY